MILLVDNYDSFTWNLVQRLGEIDDALVPERDLLVKRHDEIDAQSAAALDGGRGPTHVIVSPGPCTPREAGNSGSIISSFAGKVPVLGVCLGHQCLADEHGMVVERHAKLMHGKTSEITHDGAGVFEGIDSPMLVARYHSLVVRRASVTDPVPGEDHWAISASCVDEIDGSDVEVVMGLRRVWRDETKAPLIGVQFHPESFMTPAGSVMLWNFLRMGAGGTAAPRPAISDEYAPLM